MKTQEQKDQHNIASRKYYANNKEKHRLLVKRRRQLLNPLKSRRIGLDHDKIIAQRKRYYQKHIEQIKEKDKLKYLRRKSIIQENNKQNREIINKKYRDHISKRMKIDPLFKLSRDIPKLVRISIKRYGYSKKSKTYQILGCDWETLKSHIENQFEPWMNWENKGKYNGELNYGWDIDHIIPVSKAKNEEEMIRLNHYTNLQPLDSFVNRYIKSNKVA